MANTTTSPNMGLIIPTVSVDPGPDWADNINASLQIIDQHDHSTGQGVPITPAGLLINSDLSIIGNNLTQVRSVRFTAQGSPISQPTDLGCLYEAGVDLYYNDGGGNQIRITQSGSVAGASGTITGLPSGTASASFSSSGGGTFTFLAATSTPANFVIGPVKIGRNAVSPKSVTLTPNAAQAGDYTLVFPVALPASSNYMTLDNTGQLSFNSSGSTGSGAVVLSNSPTLSGTVAGSFAMSGLVQANGGLQKTAFINTTTSAAVTLTISDNPHQVFTSITGATTVNLPTTSVQAGDVWTIELTANQLLTVRASDGTAFTTANAGVGTIIDCYVGSQTTSRVVARAKIATPVGVTDWSILEVVDSGKSTGTSSGIAWSAVWARYNNVVTMNLKSVLITIVGPSFAISSPASRLLPYGGDAWTTTVAVDNSFPVGATVQYATGGSLTFRRIDGSGWGTDSGLGGFSGSTVSGATLVYNIYNNF